MSERRGKAEIGRPEPPPGGQGDAALRDILAGVAAVGTLLDAGFQPHLAVGEDAILLHHHRVGAVRHRRAGEDADRLAPRHRPAERVTGGDPAGHRQHGVPVREQIGMGDRETVDGAVGVRRHIDTGDQIVGENAAGSNGKRQRLRLDDRHHPLVDQRKRRVDAEQRAAEGKTIVAQLRHRRQAQMIRDEGSHRGRVAERQ